MENYKTLKKNWKKDKEEIKIKFINDCQRKQEL